MSLAGFAFARAPGATSPYSARASAARTCWTPPPGRWAAAHRPGSVEFVLAPFVAATDGVAQALAQSLRSAGHPTRTVDAAGLKELVADPDLADTYVIGFGLDTGPSIGLAPLLREGPARRVHLLGWWRGCAVRRGYGGGRPVTRSPAWCC